MDRLSLSSSEQANPGEFGLWVLRNQKPQPLQTEPGGDFMITQTVLCAVAQQVWQFYRCSLKQKTFGFLPQFGMVLDFAGWLTSGDGEI